MRITSFKFMKFREIETTDFGFQFGFKPAQALRGEL